MKREISKATRIFSKIIGWIIVTGIITLFVTFIVWATKKLIGAC